MTKLTTRVLLLIYSLLLTAPLFAAPSEELRNAIAMNNFAAAKIAVKKTIAIFRNSKTKGHDEAMLLLSAFQKRRYEIAEMMLREGFDANAVSQSGYPLLFETSMAPDEEPLGMLIKYGANINAVDKKFEKTALHIAVILGHLHHVYTLVNAGADLNIVDGSGETVLSHLVRFVHIKELNYVLKKGADVNTLVGKDNNRSALSIAVADGQRAIVELLLAYNADPNAGEISWRPIAMALLDGHTEFIEQLVTAGGRIDTFTNSGYTFLVSAALLGRYRRVELLIAQGANVNLSNSKGFTPLIVAAQQGYLQICKILLSNKADRNIKNKEGKTALDLARANYHFDIVKLLEN